MHHPPATRDADAPGMTTEPARAARTATRRVMPAVAWLALTVLYVVSPVVTNFDSYLTVPTAHTLVYERSLDLREFDALDDHYALEQVGSRQVGYSPW